MAERIDQFLALFKWPFALHSHPLPARCSHRTLASGAGHGPLTPTDIRVSCWGLQSTWEDGYFWFRKRIWGSAFSTLEHELTHALFGLLTFRIIRGIKISWSGGGHVRFKGAANWVIFIAPYWFPTLTIAMVPVIFFVEDLQVQIAMALLGATVGYHLCSTWNEVHPSQSDLQKGGIHLLWVTLPFLNMLAYGAILAYMLDGFSGIMELCLRHLQPPLRMGRTSQPNLGFGIPCHHITVVLSHANIVNQREETIVFSLGVLSICSETSSPWNSLISTACTTMVPILGEP